MLSRKDLVELMGINKRTLEVKIWETPDIQPSAVLKNKNNHGVHYYDADMVKKIVELFPNLGRRTSC